MHIVILNLRCNSFIPEREFRERLSDCFDECCYRSRRDLSQRGFAKSLFDHVEVGGR